MLSKCMFRLRLCVLLVIVTALSVAAQSSPGADKTRGELSQTFSFNTGDLRFSTEAGYDTVSIPGGYLDQNNPGLPAVPSVMVNVLLPDGAEVIDIQVSPSGRTQAAADILLKPVQPPRCVSETEPPVWYEPAATVYNGNNDFPSKRARLTSGTRKLRGWHFAEVELSPLVYVPADKKLYLTETIEVTVIYQQDKYRTLSLRRENDRFARLVRKLVVNPELMDEPAALNQDGSKNVNAAVETLDESGALDVNPPGDGNVDYLIITQQSFMTAFQSLADHRAGFNCWDTEIISRETIETDYAGDDIQMKIRNCIIDYVDNYGTTFVVLGGDDTIIPDRDCIATSYNNNIYDMPTDMYYAGLDGTWDHWNNNGVYGEVNVNGNSTQDEYDDYADVYVGRIPVRTPSQALDYISKVIIAELNEMQQPYFQHKVLLGGSKCWNRLAGDDRPDVPVCDGHIGFRDVNHPIVDDAENWCRVSYRDTICEYDWPATETGLMFDTLNSWDNDGSSGPTSVNYQDTAEVRDRLSEGWNILIHMAHGSFTGTSLGSYSTGFFNLTGLISFWHTGACNTGGFDKAEPSMSENLLRNPDGGALVYMGTSRTNFNGIAQRLNEEFLRLIAQEGMTNIGEIFYEHKLTARLDNQYERWVFYGMNLQGDPGLQVINDEFVDNDPPTPNPAVWQTPPTASNWNEITMTAMTGTDQLVVQYYFDEISGNPGGDDSGWQLSPVYTDDGLEPGMEYRYQVRMKDSFDNQTQPSDPESARTYYTCDFNLSGQVDTLDFLDMIGEWLDEYEMRDPGLVGLWTFDGASGAIVTDHVGGNDGIIYGGASLDGSGRLSLDGVNDYVKLPIGSLLSGLTNSTFAAWVDFSNSGGAWQRIFDFGSGTPTNMFLTPRTGTNGPMRFAIKVNNSSEQQATAPATLAGGMHHVAVTINADQDIITLYLDGSPAAQNTNASFTPAAMGVTTNNWLGKSQYTADGYLAGSLDEFSIFNYCLGHTQIETLSLSGVTGQKKAEDLDGDGNVDFTDMAIFFGEWLLTN